MVFVKTFIVIAAAFLALLAAVHGFQRFSFQRTELLRKQPRLCDAKKDAVREEQWRIQQEMLARRKNKPEMQKLFSSVEERRKATWEKVDFVESGHYECIHVTYFLPFSPSFAVSRQVS